MMNQSIYNDTLQEDLEFENTVATFQYFVEGIGIIVIGSIGLFINLFAFYILFRKQVSFSKVF